MWNKLLGRTFNVKKGELKLKGDWAVTIPITGRICKVAGRTYTVPVEITARREGMNAVREGLASGWELVNVTDYYVGGNHHA